MSIIKLTDQEWGQVMNCMGYAPGRECIPLLNKMSAQLQAQLLQQEQQQTPASIRVDANGQEARHE
jgi:hypothetical protein